jgi:hypothetical protein
MLPAASAQTPPSGGEQVVYWPLVTDGSDYRRVSYPQEAGPLLVLADTEIVIEARRADVSYWPITREYVANFAGGPQLVEGTLEIVDGSGRPQVFPPETFVVSYPEGVGVGRPEILRGEEAVAYYDEYVRTARAAFDKQKEYQGLVARHQALVEAWLKLAAKRPKNLPPPPPDLDIKEPEPFLAYATEPRQATVLTLSEGVYTIRIGDTAGRIVPGSERRLVSFAPLNEAVGYVLRPEDRWTQPVVSFAPRDAIYTTGHTDLFFQPVPVAEYEAHRYTRLFQPQSIEAIDPSLTLWVPQPDGGEPAEDRALGLWQDGAVVATLPRTAWRVSQLPGVLRGYEIEEFAAEEHPSLQPDFSAMRMEAGTLADKVALLGLDQVMVQDSARAVRQVNPRPEPFMFLPAFLPLLVGAAARFWMRR